MRSRRLLFLAVVATMAPAIALWGPARALAGDDVPKLPFERYRLANGLEVILHQDNSVPLVAVDLWYHVGARNETPGHSGFAHLFEHMLFQGAEHIGEDVHFDVLRKIGGGQINGSTSFDRTNYFEVVPSHQLETALWLESDRMGYFLPMLTDKSFRNQVDVVRNERRQNYDNVPYRGALFPLFEAMYAPDHPHRHLVIGLHEHLARAGVDEIIAFYRTWYVPANATLVIAGDFDRAQVGQQIEKWFGTFPKSVVPPGPAVTEPLLKESKRIQHADGFAKLRQVQYVWHTPAAFADGEAEMDIAADALGANGTGRLYKILVVQKKLAQEVDVGQWSFQNSGLFFVTVTLKSDADLQAVEAVMRTEVERVLKQPIEQNEFDRAITKHEAGFIWGLESLLNRAETLQKYNHFVSKPDFISEDLGRFRQSSPAGVHKVLKTYLSRPRVELIIIPKPASEKAATN